MDLNELLSYKPTKRAGEKRPREGGGNNAPPPTKAARGHSRSAVANVPPVPAVAEVAQPPAIPSTQDSGNSVAVLDLNGISHEEKLRILQTVDVDEEDIGKCTGHTPHSEVTGAW
jgi:hypothetical protein